MYMGIMLAVVFAHNRWQQWDATIAKYKIETKMRKV